MKRATIWGLALALTTAAQVQQPATPRHPPARGSLPAPGDDLASFFTAMDADADGVISRAEFSAWFGSTPVSAGGGGDGLATYFAMMDTNHDGQISRDEFVRFNTHVAQSGD